jgi:hypothetical protein
MERLDEGKRIRRKTKSRRSRWSKERRDPLDGREVAQASPFGTTDCHGRVAVCVLLRSDRSHGKFHNAFPSFPARESDANHQAARACDGLPDGVRWKGVLFAWPALETCHGPIEGRPNARPGIASVIAVARGRLHQQRLLSRHRESRHCLPLSRSHDQCCC